MKVSIENIDTIMFAPCGMNCKARYKHCYYKKAIIRGIEQVLWIF